MAQTPLTNVAERTVTELSADIKRTVEDVFGLVRVRGEISGYRGPHSSGHAYFALKDEGARIDAVIWRTSFAKMKVKPQEGLEVIATGRLTTFPGKSAYQIIVETIEPAGLGALMKLLEERRRKLAAEGLFDESRKRPLPFLPKVIGVVTSPTGAVIRDILHRLDDRFPRHVLVWPVRVQGEGSAEEVAAAIRGFGALAPDGPIPRPDVIVVARGGGSLEDLWGFNEEAVVRAAAASPVPLVAAVGHETDWTLIDYVADRRAPTPTGAAEMIVPVRADLIAETATLGGRLEGAVARLMDARRTGLSTTARLLPTPVTLFAVPRQRLDTASERLPRALVAHVRVHGAALARLAGRLSPALLASQVARASERTTTLSARAGTAVAVLLTRRRERLAAAAARFEAARMASLRAEADRLATRRETVERLAARAARALDTRLAREAARLQAAGGLLAALSYRAVLGRGFALLRDEEGHPVASTTQAHPGRRLEAEVADGRFAVTVEGAPPAKGAATPGETVLPPPAAADVPRRRKLKAGSAPQADLFDL